MIWKRKMHHKPRGYHITTNNKPLATNLISFSILLSTGNNFRIKHFSNALLKLFLLLYLTGINRVHSVILITVVT